MQGSGVVVGPGKVITNCHVIRSGNPRINVVAKEQEHSAVLEYADKLNDICQLSVKGLSTPELAISGIVPKIGQRVYAIGAPLGLDKTLSEGLVSGLRQDEFIRDIIQISVPITHGSSGGALVDENGVLVGITTSGLRDGNLNFAMPATLVRYISERGRTFLGDSTLEEDFAYEQIRLAIDNRKMNFAPPTVRKVKDIKVRDKFDAWARKFSVKLRNRITDDQTRNDFIDAVWYEAMRAGVEPNVLLAVVAVESNFRRVFVSNSGALGYMGVSKVWLRKVGDGDTEPLFDTHVNLRYGSIILRLKMDEFEGDLDKALNAYKGFPVDSPAYPAKVLAEWRRLE